MPKYFLYVKIDETNFKHFQVPKEVYVYVCQLENALRYSRTKEAMKQLYPGRFEEGRDPLNV